MNLGDPKPKIPQNQEAKEKAEAFVRPQIQKLLESAKEEPDKKHFVLEHITPFGRKLFAGKENIFDGALAKIEATPYATDTELEEILVQELGQAILEFVIESGFTEQDAKRYFRRILAEIDGNTLLDDDGVLSYSRFEDELDLHITDGFTMEIFHKDASKLAEIIRADKSIRGIKMTSWVVAKHPKIIERFGFSISEPLSEAEQAEVRSGLPPEMNDKPLAEAKMAREDFLLKYGSK